MSTVEGTPPAFASGQVVTVFRNRLATDHVEEYSALAPEVLARARTRPGFVDAKTFVADDGERVTIATFADEASQRAWREDVEHVAAQRAGRDRLYTEYSVQVCTCDRVSTLRP